MRLLSSKTQAGMEWQAGYAHYQPCIPAPVPFRRVVSDLGLAVHGDYMPDVQSEIRERNETLSVMPEEGENDVHSGQRLRV